MTPACYAHLTHMLMRLAGGRLIVCLEVSPLAVNSFDMTHSNHWLGRLQPSINLKVGSRCDSNSDWRNARAFDGPDAKSHWNRNRAESKAVPIKVLAKSIPKDY